MGKLWKWILKRALHRFVELVEIEEDKNYIIIVPEDFENKEVLFLSDELEKRFEGSDFVLVHGGVLIKLM